GYAACIEAFDRRLPELREAAGSRSGLLFITGDHGCDPTTPSTDHSRERTPVLVSGARGTEPVALGDRACFADLGATIAEVLGVSTDGLAGVSFAGSLA